MKNKCICGVCVCVSVHKLVYSMTIGRQKERRFYHYQCDKHRSMCFYILFHMKLILSIV